MGLTLVKVSETQNKITLSWTRPDGQACGALYDDRGLRAQFGKDAARATFEKGHDPYEVAALCRDAFGDFRAEWGVYGDVPPSDLPFAEAVLVNPLKPTISPTQTSFACETGKDYLIDLGMTPRKTLVLTGSPRNVQINNSYFRITDPMSVGPYWRGGIALQLKAQHISLTNYFVEAHFSGCTLSDGFRVAATPDTKVTLQRFRIEGRDNTDEPAEHCDSYQVQGPVGELEIGLGTAQAPGVQPPNHGGKCFQIAHNQPAGFPTPQPFSVAYKKVNMAGLGEGGARFGTMFIRGPELTYGPITVTLEDVWARSDGTGATDFPGWFATFTPGPAGTVTGTKPNRRITFDPASKITGHISEGGADFVTRAMLGV